MCLQGYEYNGLRTTSPFATLTLCHDAYLFPRLHFLLSLSPFLYTLNSSLFPSPFCFFLYSHSLHPLFFTISLFLLIFLFFILCFHFFLTRCMFHPFFSLFPYTAYLPLFYSLFTLSLSLRFLISFLSILQTSPFLSLSFPFYTFF